MKILLFGKIGGITRWPEDIADDSGSPAIRSSLHRRETHGSLGRWSAHCGPRRLVRRWPPIRASASVDLPRA
ncbi:hypothetical protein [Rhodopila globiformis]|uniref:hypothetical protein n=1 Tax=Rhodopila globiformis TaxID=1071 RepID=UPI0011B00C6B|nr:hypothetical protein [Rhodopila globiformis]